MIRSSLERTQRRIQLHDEYVRSNLISDGTFICTNFGQCHQSANGHPFYEGQMSHIGRNFDLDFDGRPLRIVVVGQEYGHGPNCVDRASRSEMIAASAESGFKGRNPHMRGTTSILRLLLGRSIGDDNEGERLLDGHIFDAFALVNYLLCSAIETPRDPQASGGGRGCSSPIMRRNCAVHFRQALRVLEPTVIVAQGKGVRAWLAKALSLPARGPTTESVDIDGRTASLLSFTHPSAISEGGWGRSLRSDYLWGTVVPTIRAFHEGN